MLKKVVKWYFNQAAKTYVWTPSGMIPYKQNMDA